jgi:hypothetical protein
MKINDINNATQAVFAQIKEKYQVQIKTTNYVSSIAIASIASLVVLVLLNDIFRFSCFIFDVFSKKTNKKMISPLKPIQAPEDKRVEKKDYEIDIQTSVIKYVLKK